MTALKQYQRLESVGLWRASPLAQRREVVVSFGDASLIISEGRSDMALSHWSLPAVERLNPGGMPALYSPGGDAIETLEIEDAAMVSALSTVHQALEDRKPRPGRLRHYLLSGGLALVLGLGFFWMPSALIEHTAQVVPPAKRAEIGRLVLADMVSMTGAPCAEPSGLTALGKLRDRVMGPGNGELLVLPEGLELTAHVPGRVVLISRKLLEDQDGPDAVAGFILAERLREDAEDSMLDLLRAIGLRATFGLLTTGDLPAASLAGYGDLVLTRDRKPVDTADLLARFAEAGVPATPYAKVLDPTGGATADLIAGDPYAVTPPPEPVIADGDWVTLQGICSN